MSYSNDFEKYIKHFRVDHNLTRAKMAREMDIPHNTLFNFEKLRSQNQSLMNKLVNYMGLNEEQEQFLSDLFDSSRALNRTINLNNYPEKIALLVSSLLDNYTNIKDSDLNKILKILSK